MSGPHCYSWDAYCDSGTRHHSSVGGNSYGGPLVQFTGENWASVKRHARKNGWRFKAGDDSHATCPECVKKGL